MNKELSTPAAVVIVVVVAVIILFVGWRMINREPRPVSNATSANGGPATMPSQVPGQTGGTDGPQQRGAQPVTPNF